MVKKFIFLFLLTTSILSFGKTIWNGEDGRLRVLYKILDPLIVNVEDTVRLKANSLEKEFTYSSKNKGQFIRVEVAAPYDQGTIDEYLRKVYERVYFELMDKGNFELTNIETNAKIKGKGYFIDENAGINRSAKESSYNKPFSSTTFGNSFNTTTAIDIDFTLPDGDVPMGVYRGDLILNVWFGGSIN